MSTDPPPFEPGPVSVTFNVDPAAIFDPDALSAAVEAAVEITLTNWLHDHRGTVADAVERAVRDSWPSQQTILQAVRESVADALDQVRSGP